LTRVEELFEARSPKAEALISSVSGKVHIEIAEDDSKSISITGKKHLSRNYDIHDAKKVLVTDGAVIKNGQVLFIDAEEVEIQSPIDGEAKLEGGILNISGYIPASEVHTALPSVSVLVNQDQEIEAGTQLTEGSVDPKKLADVSNLGVAQRYVLDEVQKVFNEQGVSIGDIHIEVIKSTQ
jgi:DNA-directed RNA polymerase subunit beta'